MRIANKDDVPVRINVPGATTRRQKISAMQPVMEKWEANIFHWRLGLTLRRSFRVWKTTYAKRRTGAL
ncbi:hypothetical protein [Desulfofustis glycolicus]|uniref:Uncharacterized protein n=1 Tax=Desulfofustis glycolicus DSM 9705 TaxID=1121409 RepID=A0A1M5UPK0_9BACT|nr:hypothetical protein [Desulfofustis glycolicus]MCB2217370.1 hypothetical protein [Desulfobulbaceae bacterium]SHH64880.1 hypothetical protein SAMN02745124_01296 [Desulfofustis glycolicus DSM 9705]